jgi:hypothetical protein
MEITGIVIQKGMTKIILTKKNLCLLGSYGNMTDLNLI